MKEYLGHKFIPFFDSKNIGTGLQYHKCNICNQDALWALDDNTWYYFKYGAIYKHLCNLELSCEEWQIKKLLE